MAMKYGDTNYTTNKMEVRQMFLHSTNKLAPCTVTLIYIYIYIYQITNDEACHNEKRMWQIFWTQINHLKGRGVNWLHFAVQV